MAKTFCDVCGKELTALESITAYSVSIISNNRIGRIPWARKYSEVCEGCTEKISNFINSLKEKTNG